MHFTLVSCCWVPPAERSPSRQAEPIKESLLRFAVVLSAIVAEATVVVTAARILDRAFGFPANVHLAFSLPILITGVVALAGVALCQIELSYETTSKAQRRFFPGWYRHFYARWSKPTRYERGVRARRVPPAEFKQ